MGQHLRMHANCAECTRLGSDLALATRHFLKLQSCVESALAIRNGTTVSILSPKLKCAGEERLRLADALERHLKESSIAAGV